MAEYVGRIDTEEEIKQIRYQPFFEKDKKTYSFESITEEDAEEDTLLPDGKEESLLGDNLLGETLKEVETLQDVYIQTLEKYESQLANTTIQTPSFLQEEIGKEITYLDYKNSLISLETPKDQWVVDIWEKEAEDMEGNLYMELYGDVVEMGAEIQLLRSFCKNHLWRFYDIKEAWTEKGFEEIEKKEKQWSEQREKEKEKVEKATLSHRKKLLLESKRTWNASFKEKEQTSITYNEMTEKEGLLLKDLSFVQEKTFECERTLSDLSYGAETSYYKEEETLPLDLLILGESKEEVKRNLTNISALLKVSLDNQNKEKAGVKASLRTLYHPKNQRKIQSEYFLNKASYLEMGLSVLPKIKSINEAIGEGLHTWMESTVEGLVLVKENAEKYGEDVYNTSFSSHNRRNEKIKDVLKKHKGRETYWLAQQLKKEIDEKGLPTVNTYQSYLNEGEI